MQHKDIRIVGSHILMVIAVFKFLLLMCGSYSSYNEFPTVGVSYALGDIMLDSMHAM